MPSKFTTASSDIADTQAIAVHATDVAIGVATMAYHFAGNPTLRHPHILGRISEISTPRVYTR